MQSESDKSWGRRESEHARFSAGFLLPSKATSKGPLLNTDDRLQVNFVAATTGGVDFYQIVSKVFYGLDKFIALVNPVFVIDHSGCWLS